MPLNMDWQQILLHMLNFVILFFVLYFLLYAPVKKFMDQRREKFLQEKKDAEEKAARADALKAEYEARLADVDKEIAEKQKAFQAQLAEQSAAVLQNARDEAQQITDKAKAQAQKEHDAWMKTAESEIADMASDMAKKLTQEGGYDAFLNAAERSRHE